MCCCLNFVSKEHSANRTSMFLFCRGSRGFDRDAGFSGHSHMRDNITDGDGHKVRPSSGAPKARRTDDATMRPWSAQRDLTCDARRFGRIASHGRANFVAIGFLASGHLKH